jgi:mRNA-degrading endonuclease YafQ of YafQ-DinJ toxin-antitoxin module
MKIEFLKKFYKDLDKITTNNLKSDLMNVILEIEKHKDITEIKNMIKGKILKMLLELN